ncbi:plastocyanin/azurin family copper-binding protein [Halobacterium sp. CBA1126]|uniref:plastocyanin/azurin family copper-binding protein n=1 Tax=Halobacterium TaxID=2239 RepID=UPI0012F96573|nr:plastocyanin/azurin family copper-binding protein [Halobacterium sp. CBA1126]MUV60280.1 hypothetical protein [Halobacterium sp. CBA1126]
MKRRDFLKIATGSAGGAAAIGAAGARSASTSAAVQEDDGNNTTSDNGTAANGTAENGTTSGGGEGESDELPGAGTTKTVAVGPNGNNVFDPETVYVQPGATVQWVWESDGHNVAPDGIPDGASWEGHEPIENSGFEYEHTFDGPTGEYNYICTPHAQLGMEGVVVVNESGEAPGGGGGGGGASGPDPHHMGVPFQAHFVGIATILMMIVSLVYAFFVLKYGESPNASAPNKE